MSPSQDLTSNHLADMLNDCSIDRIMAIDNEWRIIAWNRTAEIASGISRTEVIGMNLLEVFLFYRQDKELMAAIELAFSGIRSFVPSSREIAHRQHYENHFIPLKDAEGQILGVMNIMHDVATASKPSRSCAG